MTIERTIEIPSDRWVQIEFLVPQEIPLGVAEVAITFNGPAGAKPAAAGKSWRSLYGLYKDTGDTLDAYLERHRADNELEYELEELHLKEREQFKKWEVIQKVCWTSR